jgi:hypothetical protein
MDQYSNLTPLFQSIPEKEALTILPRRPPGVIHPSTADAEIEIHL